MRKHVIRVLIASLLIGSCLNVTAYAEGATVTGSQVNVRSGPGVSYDVLGSVSRGTILEVTDRSNSDWYAISYGGRVGYISASYVTLEDVSYPAAVVPDGSASAPGGGSTVSGSSGTINGSYVRFRKGPSSSSEILGEYSQGKALTILGTSGDWTACVIDGQEGFVYSQFVSVDSAAEASPATVIQTPEPAATPAPNGNGILIRDSASTQAGNTGTVSGGTHRNLRQRPDRPVPAARLRHGRPGCHRRARHSGNARTTGADPDPNAGRRLPRSGGRGQRDQLRPGPDRHHHRRPGALPQGPRRHLQHSQLLRQG